MNSNYIVTMHTFFELSSALIYWQNQNSQICDKPPLKIDKMRVPLLASTLILVLFLKKTTTNKQKTNKQQQQQQNNNNKKHTQKQQQQTNTYYFNTYTLLILYTSKPATI